MTKTIELPEPVLKAKEIDAAFYAEAGAQHGKPAPMYLAEQSPAPPELVEACKTRFLSQYGDAVKDICMDPVDQWAEGRAALNHQLMWYEQTEKKRLVTVADFYGPDSGVQSLFPAYIESEIQAGLIAAGLVPWLIFSQEQVNSETVRALYAGGNAAHTRSLKKTMPGDELPRVKLTFADSDIYLYKYGASIEAAYEVIRNQRYDALGWHFRQIAEQVAVDETDLAMDVLVGGDGTTAGAAESDSTDVDVTTAGSITYADMLSWVYNPSQPYNIDKAVAGKTDLALIANLAEFKAASKPGGYVLDIVSPLNVSYRRWDGGVSGSSYVDRLVVGVDSRRALKKYTSGGFLQETDKIITRQVNVWTFSYWTGFRKFDSAAVHVLDCNAAL